MARPKWKFKFFPKKIYKIFFKNKFKIKKLKKIFWRNSTIPNFFLKNITYIHKGYFFTKVLYSKHYIGFKFGEFALTRKPFSFPLKKKKR